MGMTRREEKPLARSSRAAVGSAGGSPASSAESRSPASAAWVGAVALGQLGGRMIALIGGNDETVVVWDLASGDEVGARLFGHNGTVKAVARGELDGQPVALSGGDRTLR